MTLKRKKISVIGSGFTGATTAFLLAQKELGDVVLVDIPQMENPTKGKALDMLEASPVQGFDAKITGTSNYEDTKDSDVVIITAGIARKPGMSRDDLVQTNQKIMKSVSKEIAKYSPYSSYYCIDKSGRCNDLYCFSRVRISKESCYWSIRGTRFSSIPYICCSRIKSFS